MAWEDIGYSSLMVIALIIRTCCKEDRTALEMYHRATELLEMGSVSEGGQLMKAFTRLSKAAKICY
eukprot:4814715-Amphidinium_carterae.2